MNKLPEDFSLNKYGLNVRLVNESDAAFILSLRANPKRTKYMITLENNIPIQMKWIQKYKKREKKGLDYYLIYSNAEEKPIGVNRISHVDTHTKTAKASSWIAVEGLHYEAIKMIIIRNEIVFNLLGINTFWSDVHKNNKKAIRILELFGYNIQDVGKTYLKLTLNKKNFFKACENKIIDKFKYE